MKDLLLREVPQNLQSAALAAGNAFTKLEREPGIANREDYIVDGNLYRCYGNKRGTLVEFKGAAADAPKVPKVLDVDAVAEEAADSAEEAEAGEE